MNQNLFEDSESSGYRVIERRPTGWASAPNVPPPYDSQPAIDDRYTSMPLGRRATRLVEEGLRPEDQPHPRSRDGLLASIIDLYTSTPETRPENSNHIDLPNSTVFHDPMVSRSNLLRRRTMSAMSAGTDADAMMDDDDPRVTGNRRNDIDEKLALKLAEFSGEKPVEEEDDYDEKRALKAKIRSTCLYGPDFTMNDDQYILSINLKANFHSKVGKSPLTLWGAEP